MGGGGGIIWLQGASGSLPLHHMHALALHVPGSVVGLSAARAGQQHGWADEGQAPQHPSPACPCACGNALSIWLWRGRSAGYAGAHLPLCTNACDAESVVDGAPEGGERWSAGAPWNTTVTETLPGNDRTLCDVNTCERDGRGPWGILRGVARGWDGSKLSGLRTLGTGGDSGHWLAGLPMRTSVTAIESMSMGAGVAAAGSLSSSGGT